MRIWSRSLWISSVALAAALPALGNEPCDATDRVSFDVQSSREVANDWVTAVIGVTEEHADPAALASQVNESMAWAVKTAKQRKGLRVESGGYRTDPVYAKGSQSIRHWRASQDLVIESEDVEAVTETVGALQARLQLRSIAFSVSPEKRRKVEAELIEEALGLFKDRAELVRRNLGAGGFGIVRIQVSASGGQPIRRRYAMEAQVMSADVARPAFEGGNSTIVASANGTIELK